MLTKRKKIQAILTVLVLLSALAGCSSVQEQEMQTLSVDEMTNEALLAQVKEKASTIDQYTDYKTDSYQTIALNGDSISFSGTGAETDGNTITITKAGTYEISGVLNDGRIIVESEDEEDVRLVLLNARITSSNGPALYVKNAENTIISLPPESESTLTDGTTNTYDEEAKGALCSSDDLVINGSGTLTVNGNFNDGISGNDDLGITQVRLIVTSADDAITANDSIAVSVATITANAQGDGFKVSNETDADKGWIAVNSGDFDITSGSDGFEAQTLLYIEDGNFTIESEEGIESKSMMQLSGGTIDLVSSDDGINTGKALTISGGEIRINAEGDGIDSNGAIYMTGGNVTINGPTRNGNGILDYTGVFEISGGTLLAAGTSGMAMSPSDGSTQYTISNSVENQAEGTEVRLTDSNGNTIVSFTPEKAYQLVTISSPDLKNGNTYTLYAGETKIADIAISSVVSGDSANTGGFGGGPGGDGPAGEGFGGGRQGGPPDGVTSGGIRPDRPEFDGTSGSGIREGRPEWDGTSEGGIGPGGGPGGGMQGGLDGDASGSGGLGEESSGL